MSGKYGIVNPNPHCVHTYDCNMTAAQAAMVGNASALLQAVAGNATLDDTVLTDMARLVVGYAQAFAARCAAVNNGSLAPLPQASEEAAQQSYLATVQQIYTGLVNFCGGFASPGNPADEALARQVCQHLPQLRHVPQRTTSTHAQMSML